MAVRLLKKCADFLIMFAIADVYFLLRGLHQKMLGAYLDVSRMEAVMGSALVVSIVVVFALRVALAFLLKRRVVDIFFGDCSVAGGITIRQSLALAAFLGVSEVIARMCCS